jgi:hypothetical protein
MRFEYDKEVNALYIYLWGKIPEGGVARTVELAPACISTPIGGPYSRRGVPGLCGLPRVPGAKRRAC